MPRVVGPKPADVKEVTLELSKDDFAAIGDICTLISDVIEQNDQLNPPPNVMGMINFLRTLEANC